MVALNPFGIQQLQQQIGQGMTEFAPQQQQQQAPPPAAPQGGGFPMPSTGNSAMDQYAQWAASRDNFLNQARQQDMANMWQRVVSSQDNFGSKYQRGRLVGQQLFNDILAPMLAGPGAGGAQGAYEFIKDTNKRIDEGLTNQTSERLKTAQTLNSLADIAGKAKKEDWDKLGATIKLHDEAARLNSAQQTQALNKARTDSAEAKAKVDQGTVQDKIAFQRAKTEGEQGKVKIGVEKLVEAKNKATKEYQKAYGEWFKNHQAYAMAPSKVAASQALVAKREAERKLAEIKQINEQIKGGTMREGAERKGALLAAKTDTEKARLGTEQSRGKVWANKAGGIDPKFQRNTASLVEMARKNGWSDSQILEHVRKEKAKDPSVIRAYEAYLAPNKTASSDDDGDNGESEDDDNDED